MGSAVKKVATVAAVAFGGYAAFGLTGPGFGYMGSGLGSFGKLGLAAKTLTASKALSIAGLGLQAASAIQQRKYAGRQAKFESQRAEAARQLEESRRRQSDVAARQQRLAAIREQRIRTGQITAATGGAQLGLAGTSGFTGAVGSLSTQAAANIGQINVAQGFAREQSGYSQQAASAASQGALAGAQAQGWSQMFSLATNMGGASKNLFNAFDLNAKG